MRKRVAHDAGTARTTIKPKALSAAIRRASAVAPIRASRKFYQMTAGLRLLLITQAVMPATQTTAENWTLENRGRFRENGRGIPRHGGRLFQVGERNDRRRRSRVVPAARPNLA
jgi:hypothetical protein